MSTSPPATRRLIEDFLKRRRIAVVGVSRNPQDFSTLLFREFLQRGYDAVPVNPHAAEVEGHACFARVQDIQPPPEAALLLTPPDVTGGVVGDCAEAGVQLLWIRRTAAPGVMEFCGVRGLRVIAGHCPFMFFPDAPWFHRFHGWLLKLAGKYPR